MKTLVLASWLLLIPTVGLTAGRDPYRQPFASTSIWNMPIGSAARYVYPPFQPAEWATIDEDYIFKLKASDPVRPVYAPQAWDRRCGGLDDQGLRLPVPDDLIVPDATPGHTPNNCAAFIMPDGHTVIQLNPLARCEAGGPVYGWKAPAADLFGDGIEGGHGGSGLSSIGGTIRCGEFTAPEPIRHALKVNVWGQKYLWKFADKDSGSVWPAWRHDGCAPECYGGTNPHLRMGSLLAIPPNVLVDSLYLETIPGRKLFWTLQNYGAYIADDTAWDAYAVAVEHGVRAEFQAAYQMAIENKEGAWYRDYMKLFHYLAIVTNNGPHRIGGGGQPRQALAAPLSQPDP